MRSIDLNSGRHLEIMLLLHYHLFLLFHIKHGKGDEIFSSTPKSFAVSLCLLSYILRWKILSFEIKFCYFDNGECAKLLIPPDH